MKGSWKQICPYVLSDFINSEETSEIITDEIVRKMNELYINLDIYNEDVNELIESHSVPL